MSESETAVTGDLSEFEDPIPDRMCDEYFMRFQALKSAAVRNTEGAGGPRAAVWQFHYEPLLTCVGKRIVCEDPNISEYTLQKLIISEKEYLSCPEMQSLLVKTKREIYEKVFLARNEEGLAHVSQCILENMDQCKAELIARYCKDGRIPFIIGAIYLDAYLSSEQMFYYRSTDRNVYSMKPWNPVPVYSHPKQVIPPQKKKDFKKYYDAVHDTSYEIPVCPLCGSPAGMFRTGFQNRWWHVCCTDPKCTCPNFFGLKPRADDRAAAADWITYCGDHRSKQQ